MINTKIVSFLFLASAIALLVSPAETFAATARKPAAKLPTAHVVARKPVVKKAAKPTPALATIFLPNGALIRHVSAVSTAAPVAVLGIKQYSRTITHNEPIILSGSDVLEIKNTHYIQNGSITLKDNAKLIITNSYFEQRNTSGSAPRLDATQFAQVIIKNSDVGFSPWIVWKFADHSELTLDALKVTENDGDAPIYYEITGNTKADIRKALFTASIADTADVTIDKSARVSLTLNLSGGAVVNEQFPKNITDYSFPGFDDRNIAFKLKITNAVASEWGVMIYPTSDITIHDTEGLTIGFSVIYPWVNATATFENLHPGYYDDDKFGFSQTTAQFWDRNMKVHLVKTNVKAWNPMVGDDNTLVLKNSIVSELPWSWGNAKIILENSTTTFMRARQSVEITAKNSTITGDINAIEDGKINLIHTQVLGKKIIQGKGQIVQ